MARAPIVVAVAVALVACVPAAIAPPVRGAMLDSPDVLERGAVAVGGEAGGSRAAFGPTPVWATLRARVGVGGRVEIEAQGTYTRGNFEPSYGVDDQAGMGRLGARVELVPGVLTLAWGAGLAGSVMGPTFATDLGLVLGWENPYVVPFLYAGGLVAEPLDRAPVRIRVRNDDGTTRLRTLEESRGVGLQLTAGLRVPLHTEDPHVRVSVLAAFVFTGVWGAELSAPNDFLLVGGTGGLEVAFDPAVPVSAAR